MDDKMYLTVTYAEPVMTEESANKLVDNIVSKMTSQVKAGEQASRTQSADVAMVGA